MRVVQVSESEFTVQGHGVHTAFLETTNGLRKIGVEVLVNKFKKADVRHFHTFGPYALLQLMFPGKKVISAHVVPDSLVGSIGGAKYWLPLATRYLRWYYNRARAVIAVSDSTKKALEEFGVKKPIHVIYNMVDTGWYKTTAAGKAAARRELGYAENEWIVIGNGQVQPRKRVDTFLKLAKALPDMTFVWVGGIPFKHLADDYAEMLAVMKNPPKNVRFTDVITREQVRLYTQAADVFVMPSDQETFGLAIVEGAAAGLPVVLRDIADYDQTFRGNALMCSDDEAFQKALVELRDDKKLYEKMQLESAKLAERYDSTKIAKQLVELYKTA